MFRLILVNPSNIHKGLGNIRDTSWPPLNLPYIAALTPDHYHIELIDENIEPFRFQVADIVGITSYTATIYRAYQIAKVYREQNIPTVIGGIHVSMVPEEALRFCNTVVVGEAEYIWPKILEDFEAGKLKRYYYGSQTHLNDLPIPRRDILKNSHYKWGTIQTSRGCPMGCSFCSVTAFNGKVFRRRHLASVIEELRQIPQKRIMIADDNIIGYGKRDLEWAKSFFARVADEKIRKVFFAQSSVAFGEDTELIRIAAGAGLRVVFLGIESINSESLVSYRKRINLEHFRQKKTAELIKNIRKGGIAVYGAFVIGSDDDQKSIFDETLQFVKNTHIDVLQVTKLTPLPGTRLWAEMQGRDRIIDKNFPKAWDSYRFTKMVFKPAHMSIQEVYKGFTYLRIKYYGFWETMKRTIRTLMDTKSIYTTIIAYSFNFSYRKAFISSNHYHKYKKCNLDAEFETKRVSQLLD